MRSGITVRYTVTMTTPLPMYTLHLAVLGDSFMHAESVRTSNHPGMYFITISVVAGSAIAE